MLRDILGYKSVSTTERCLRVRTDQKRKAVEEAYPSLAPPADPNWREDSDPMPLLRKEYGAADSNVMVTKGAATRPSTSANAALVSITRESL